MASALASAPALARRVACSARRLRSVSPWARSPAARTRRSSRVRVSARASRPALCPAPERLARQRPREQITLSADAAEGTCEVEHGPALDPDRDEPDAALGGKARDAAGHLGRTR